MTVNATIAHQNAWDSIGQPGQRRNKKVLKEIIFKAFELENTKQNLEIFERAWKCGGCPHTMLNMFYCEYAEVYCANE